jgi:hypothetical protein
VGDAVLLDYRYAAVDAGRHRVLGINGDAFLGTDALGVWVAEGLRLAHAFGPATDARSLGGRDRTLGATWRQNLGRGRVVIEAARRSRTRSVADVSSRDLRVSWTPSTVGATRWAFGARGATSMARAQRQVSLSTDASFAWNASSTLQVLSGAEWWMWKPDGTEEYFLAAHGEISWRFGQVDLNGRYIFQQRTLEVHSDQHRFTFRLVRHF